MKTIDLSKYHEKGVRVISGRPKGEYARVKEKLDQLDLSGEEMISISIPGDVVIVNPSFFLGLIGESVALLGREVFNDRFRLESGNELVRSRWNEAIERVATETHLRG